MYLTASLSMRSASLLSKYPLCDASIVRQGLPRLEFRNFEVYWKINHFCLHWPEGSVSGGHSLLHIGLVPLLHLADLLPGGGVQGGEGFPGDAIVEIVVNENSGVLKK